MAVIDLADTQTVAASLRSINLAIRDVIADVERAETPSSASPSRFSIFLHSLLADRTAASRDMSVCMPRIFSASVPRQTADLVGRTPYGTFSLKSERSSAACRASWLIDLSSRGSSTP